MAVITAASVKELRDRTDMPMMECKAALKETEGDIEKAIELLRVRGKLKSEKRAGRETAEGRIGTSIVEGAAALVELRCETPPVTKTEGFVALANDLAKQIASTNPATIDELMTQPFVDDSKKTVDDRMQDVMILIKENMKVARFERLEGFAGDYVHHDGSVGVLVVVKGAKPDPQVLRDVCMHVAAASPVAVAATRDEVPPELLEKERSIAQQKAEATGKPSEIAAKIAEGQIKSWYKDYVLVEQPYIRDDKQTVGEVLKAAGMELVAFRRYKVGETVAANEDAPAAE